ncbi:hypothetical protein NW754_010889 [Fusarium falciforme]|uniref:Major facilitator superfamily (MFS) profile domain-containing protein n=1 Tax=Fusarium falciforme TaxID=195108 RepID=A0A9W8UXN4_9HYPO|nr:hypothetical protein NW754_010889 [Fusarium falciforme]KAJ4181183.1 hypothetical protein NW755_011226 [Fusarium falciforme]KAJ4258593.1 hypothetical protein NW757_003161 [Fusarium falciforme]
MEKDVVDDTYVPTLSAEEDAQILRKIDLYLIPIFLFSYLFQTLDKQALGFSAIMGLEEDLNLSGSQYSWASSIYYFGYLAFSYPASYLIVKLPLGKLIASACTMWGAVLIASAGSFNASGLLAARFFLGVAEASIAPGLATMVSMWYKKSEQPLRHGVWFMGNVMAGFFSSLLSYAISFIKAGISPWQILFIIFGSVTMLWGLCLLWLIPDHPTTARFLSPEQREKAVIRVATNMSSVKNDTFKMYQLLEGLADIKMWLLVLIMLSSNLANGLQSFQSIILKGFGFSKVHTYLIQMISTAFQALAVIIATAGSTYIKNSRTYFMVAIYAVGIAGAVMVQKIDPEHLWARFFGFCLCVSFVGNFPMVFAMSTANFAGFTKKATVNAAIFVAYCAANIASPQLFKASEAPNYESGFTACIICLSAAAMLSGVLRYYLIWENKKRDQLYGVPENNPEEVDLTQNLEDKTDAELPEFRYSI